MVTDQQVRKLMDEMAKHGRIGVASMKAGMDRKTGRKLSMSAVIEGLVAPLREGAGVSYRCDPQGDTVDTVRAPPGQRAGGVRFYDRYLGNSVMGSSSISPSQGRSWRGGSRRDGISGSGSAASPHPADVR